MANGIMKLVLALTGRDDGAKRLVAQTQQQLERTEKSRARLERQGRAYAQTGVRSEREIRREIIQTHEAFNRLARGGCDEKPYPRAERGTETGRGFGGQDGRHRTRGDGCRCGRRGGVCGTEAGDERPQTA